MYVYIYVWYIYIYIYVYIFFHIFFTYMYSLNGVHFQIWQSPKEYILAAMAVISQGKTKIACADQTVILGWNESTVRCEWSIWTEVLRSIRRSLQPGSSPNIMTKNNISIHIYLYIYDAGEWPQTKRNVILN